MELGTTDKGEILLTKVYSGVLLETDDKETIGICMRDTGFEFNYNGVWYEAKQGIVREMKKEEPKQETQSYICPHTKKQCDDECCVSAKDCHLEASMGVLSEPKQETLEEFDRRLWTEAFTQLFPNWNNGNVLEQREQAEIKAFIQGAKWQQEQDKNKYSEEDVLAMLLIKHDGLSPEYVLEQFKNK